MARVKIAHVITRLDLGGAQGNTLYTWSHLDRARFEPMLVCGVGGMLDEEAAALSEPDDGPRLRRLSALVREVDPARDLLALLQLINLFLAERPAIVHTHSSKAGILGRLAAAFAGVPVIVHTYHGFGFNDYQPSLLKSLYAALERFCCRFTRAIVFVSRANEEYARRHRLGDPARYHLIRSGVRLSELPARVAERGKAKAALGFGMHKPLVLSIGNLKPQKNPADFLAMAERVGAQEPDTEFLFVGDGPLRQRLEFQLIAKGLAGRVKLPGWRRDTAQLLALADVFVLTSLWEGLPRALVEALKSGVPAVCYAADGVVDLLQDGVNGFVVAPRDVNALSDRVLRLLRDGDLRRGMGERARASVGPEYDIDLMVRAQERLYDALVIRD
jgi:glycosyltransferase involved in cell wall biosynthesis